ncbi:MAG: exonuclease domain-containing protein [Lachnospiraceae bacterium]
MNYIVLDLEWNQSARGKQFTNPELPFEIIQFGAVKLNHRGNVLDVFDRMVCPVVYPKLHSAVRELVPFSEQELKSGNPFPVVFAEFMHFCGEDYRFCTWGSQDLWQLQQNIRYHQLLNPFPKLLRYYDVQKLFSIACEDGKIRRTVEYAADIYGLNKELPFHSAVNDARYVVRIFQRLMEKPEIMERISVDYFLPPLIRKEEICLRFQMYTKYVYRVFESREEAMKDRAVAKIKCPVCGRNLRKKIRWFTANTKKYYCVAHCPEHGYVRGKIQMKKTGDEAGIFPIKIVKLSSEEGVEKIVEMKKQVVEKRRAKRMKQGS